MTDKTVTIPSFLTEAQFHDPAVCQIDDLGPVVCLFIPHLELGGMWLTDEGGAGRWILQYPLTMETHIAAVRRWLAGTDQMGAAMRYCRAAGTLPPPAQQIN